MVGVGWRSDAPTKTPVPWGDQSSGPRERITEIGIGNISNIPTRGAFDVAMTVVPLQLSDESQYRRDYIAIIYCAQGSDRDARAHGQEYLERAYILLYEDSACSPIALSPTTMIRHLISTQVSYNKHYINT